MENKENTKILFFDFIPRIQEMIRKEESHISKMRTHLEEFQQKQKEQKKSFIGRLFPVDYSDAIDFVKKSINRAEKSKRHFELRLEEYKKYAETL